MKKTITLAALVLGLAGAALAETTYTLGDTTYTTTSAWGTSGGNYTGFTFTLDYSLLSTGSFTTTASTESASLPTSGMVALNSIKLIQRSNANITAPARLVITQNGNSDFAAIASISVTKMNDATLNNYTRDYYTWTFDAKSALLEVGKTYTISYQDSSGNSLSWGTQAVTSGTGAGFTTQSSAMPAAMEVVTQSVIATEVTDSVPEPTTATLSLLALAGLAARRRRK